MPTTPRIQVIDALRGFALLGIIMIHSIEHFELFMPVNAESPLVLEIDQQVFESVLFLVSGKAYSIFAFLFGYSFFIQMKTKELQGVDFRNVFLWRLLVLLAIGLVHSMIYRGDILHIYALMGMPLVSLYKVGSRTLLVVTSLLILQIPTLGMIVESFVDPSYIYTPYYGDGYYEEGEQIYSSGSLWDVVVFNLYKARVVVWTWTYHTGRFFQLMALFILGLVIARQRYFENLKAYRYKATLIGYFSLIFMLLLNLYLTGVESFDWTDSQKQLVMVVVQSYLNAFYTTAICCGFILVYFYFSKRVKIFDYLSSYGRLSLTNYVSQALIGVLIFYDFGLGLWEYVGATVSLIFGLGLFVIQVVISARWLKTYKYGPMEWLWRALTYKDFSIPMKKTDWETVQS
ncbi:DUF418 domain-containing protein [Reichenbachiella agarivorans]|uniref:DUF418 domain-containing protein n=1 Tax=Reichenbachiella agarivorans TaxID=2979464 RepID=A0ABY6CR83_9BACT|nr:DUF418 domain-containing protein [Reichenbachiella agarivorans]UXP33012.1 DUF418 domain-containing protein [Reichenbachiella agarivorans]